MVSFRPIIYCSDGSVCGGRVVCEREEGGDVRGKISEAVGRSGHVFYQNYLIILHEIR